MQRPKQNDFLTDNNLFAAQRRRDLMAAPALNESTMKNIPALLFPALLALVVSACSTSNSGGYTYKSTNGSNVSQQQNGPQASSSNQATQAQTSTSSTWSSKSSFSVGGGTSNNNSGSK